MLVNYTKLNICTNLIAIYNVGIIEGGYDDINKNRNCRDHGKHCKYEVESESVVLGGNRHNGDSRKLTDVEEDFIEFNIFIFLNCYILKFNCDIWKKNFKLF